MTGTSRGPQVFRRSGGRQPAEIVREELWFWLEGLLGWLPGRLGRLIRSACYQPFIPSDGAVDVAEHTHIRMPWKLTCGRQVSIGRGSQLTCTEGITLGDDVWIGANAVVLPGVTIGTGSVIAAGAVVREDVPPFAVVAGAPARVVSWRGDGPQRGVEH